MLGPSSVVVVVVVVIVISSNRHCESYAQQNLRTSVYRHTTSQQIPELTTQHIKTQIIDKQP